MKHAKFADITDFQNVRIDGDFGSSMVRYLGSLNFSNAQIGGEADFSSSEFGSPANFTHTEFSQPPSFVATKFDYHISLEKLEIKLKSDNEFKDTDAERYRRLKQLANLAQDHLQEQNFFAMEQKAMRGTRYKKWAVIPSFLYEKFSDFGRSLARPAGCLLGTWLFFAAAYFVAAPKAQGIHISLFGAKQISWQEWVDFLCSFGSQVSSAMLYSASQILPFVSASREVKTRALKHLFDDKVPDYLGWLNISEGLLAFIFLFLIGLALRNRFRI